MIYKTLTQKLKNEAHKTQGRNVEVRKGNQFMLSSDIRYVTVRG
jgi:hypothetical protein